MRKPFNHLKKQIAICAILLSAAASPGFAQVKGISYTISPTGEYVFWNKNTGISDGFLVGGHLGFGFGEFIELRGTYLQDVGNLKRDFSGLSAMGLRNAKLDSFNIGVTRWGGDIKLNLSRGSLVPYLTIGTGVQTLSPDTLTKYKNIYVAAGAGFQLSGGDRYTFNVQAVNTAFNGSPVRSLTSAAERTANGLLLSDYSNEMLRNWSVRASLNLYLGGRRPGELTDVDKAYLNNFSSGISLPIEITAGQLDFGKGLPYANTKYAGVATGLNFGPYVGLRAFYWRGLEDTFTSKFTKLALYGGEGKFKLGNGQGLTPALLLGGGVIDAMKGYQTDSTATPLKKKGFASGGIGLDFPLGRALKLTAYGKALLTSNDSIQNTVSPDQLATSFAYGLSLNLIIGNGAKDVETQKEKSYDELVMNTMKREKNRAEDLKDDYQKRIDRLDDQIKDTRKNGDRRMAYELEDEQDALKKQINKIEDLQEKEESSNKDANKKDDPLLMKMKPTDFGNELDDIEQDVKRSRSSNSSGRDNGRMNDRNNDRMNNRDQQNGMGDQDIQMLEDRLKSIEQKLDDLQGNGQQNRQNRRDNGNNDNYNRDSQNYPNGDYRNGNYNDGNGNYNDRNNNRNGNNDDRNNNRNGNNDGRNNNRNGNNDGRNNNRNGNNDDRNNNSRNSNNDGRNFDNRNNNSRNGNYDDRNNNDRNTNRRNGNDDDSRYDQNSNNRDNGNNSGRSFGSNGGSSRNGDARPDTNDKFTKLKSERDNGENMRKAYEDRIESLDQEIADAKDKGDNDLESKKKDEKSSMEDAVKQIRDAQDKEDRANRKAIRNNNPEDIKMSSDDFRSMMDDVKEKNKDYQQDIERSMDKFRNNARDEMRDMRDNKGSYQQGLEDEMRDLKAQLQEMRDGRNDVKKNDGRDNNGMSNNDRNDKNARRDNDNRDSDKTGADTDVFANSSLNNNSAAKTSNYLTEEQQSYEGPTKAQDGFFSVLKYDGASAIAGFNLGGATTLNIGVRNHYRYKNTNFSLMPEAFFGFGSSSAFGLFANGIYDIKIKNREDFMPYAGLGLGVMKIGNSDLNNIKAAFNIVLGANLFKIANGRFYIDVSARNFFKYTQLAAGYRLPF